MEKTPRVVKEVTPVKLVLVKYTDNDYRDSMILAAVAENITTLEDTDPNLVGAIKVIDSIQYDGNWKNSGGVSKWMALGIKQLMKE